MKRQLLIFVLLELAAVIFSLTGHWILATGTVVLLSREVKKTIWAWQVLKLKQRRRRLRAERRRLLRQLTWHQAVPLAGYPGTDADT